MDKITNNFIVKFDYNKEILEEFVKEATNIDETNIEQVSDSTKKLVKVRRAIQDQGKSFRDEANSFNKRVLEEEKEYVGIIEVVEKKYKEIIEQDKKKKIIEKRKELLPTKKKQLSLLEHRQVKSDEYLLTLDDDEWTAFYNTEFDLNEKEKQEIANIEVIEKQQKEREEEIRQEEIKRLQTLAEEKIKKEKKEKEQIESNKKYQEFLEKNKFDDSTDIVKHEGTEIKIYRLVAIFKVTQ